MEITRKETGDLMGVMTIKIAEADYQDGVIASLKKIRQQVVMKGFRKGKAPIGLVKKMHGNQAIIEEVNNVLGEKTGEYIREENLRLFGDLLPRHEDTSFNIVNSKDFTFAFDYGLFPEIDIDLAEKKLTSYNIIVLDKEIDKEIENFKKQNGVFEEEDEATDKSQLEIKLVETGKEGDDAVKSEGKILVDMIQDDYIKSLFIGQKKEAKLTIDVKKAFTNEADLAGLLKIEKEKLSEINDDFDIEVIKIEKFVIAELNQELYDKAFGEGNVKSEEELRDKFKEEIAKAYEKYSVNRFNADAQKELMKIEVKSPDEFIVKWLLSKEADKEEGKEEPRTKEDIENDLPKFKEELKWHSIKSYFLEKSGGNISREEEIEANKKLTLSQFSQYGLPMGSLNDELLTQIATESLDKLKENERHYVKEIAIEDKVFIYISENTEATVEEITMDDFQSLDKKIDTVKLDLTKEQIEDVKKEEEKSEE